jgi:uncharacterized membrane protein
MDEFILLYSLSIASVLLSWILIIPHIVPHDIMTKLYGYDEFRFAIVNIVQLILPWLRVVQFFACAAASLT